MRVLRFPPAVERDAAIDASALSALIAAAYDDMKARL